MTTAICLGILLTGATPPPDEPSPPPFARLGARFGIEVGIGPYRPQIDREFADRTSGTPYADLFGSGAPFMYRLRVHYFIPTAAGDIGLALGTGFFTDSARSLLADGRRSAGKTGIRLIPVSALARWRWPYLERWTGLPFALSTAGGVAYTFWTITNAHESAPEDQRESVRGGSLAIQAEVAVGLRLGRLEPHGAKILSREFGIEDTEIGIAFVYVGAPIGWWNDLSVGDVTWQGYFTVGF